MDTLSFYHEIESPGSSVNILRLFVIRREVFLCFGEKLVIVSDDV